MNKQQLDNFVTIMTFPSRKKLSKLREQLDTSKIEYRIVKDWVKELGGTYRIPETHISTVTKLQVRENDIQKSMEILKGAGYITDEDLQPTKFDHITSQIPILKNLRIELRLMIIFVILAIIMGVILFAILPSTCEPQLLQQSWSIEQLLERQINENTN